MSLRLLHLVGDMEIKSKQALNWPIVWDGFTPIDDTRQAHFLIMQNCLIWVVSSAYQGKLGVIKKRLSKIYCYR